MTDPRHGYGVTYNFFLMPPKRKVNRDSSASPSDDSDSAGSDFEARPRKQVAKGAGKKAAAAGPRLKKSTKPEWNRNGWSNDKLETEFAAKCIERWCLLPPYNTRLPDAQWKEYYLERMALDEINTKHSDKSKKIVSEELGQDTFSILRAASSSVAATIYGAAQLEEADKTRIARTLRGSLYFTELWGNDEEGGGDNPRTVNSKTRLYSPFGLGTSLELVYNFHWRQFRAGEQFSDFVVGQRDIEECDSADPRKCTAVVKDSRSREKPGEFSVKVFDMNNAKVKGTTAQKLTDFEDQFFGTSGWLYVSLSISFHFPFLSFPLRLMNEALTHSSPLKWYNLLCAAGTVLHYKEENRSTLKQAGTKFKFFQGESAGQELRKSEDEVFARLEKEKFAALGEDEEVCVPQRLLLLATEHSTDT
ncbi:hypothetical protein C8F04DRAFT_1129626 [Mycena alexandri]|uniref:Uncharacterized protein n=1 Tax=Mycena alexandri TaxID=1745969 RepID=A0AAD6WXT6_9AGAR|nr:hypothetical protein C8F04DRAFT_1129626 [Mycena alexandri]